jgi:hypothetical protein
LIAVEDALPQGRPMAGAHPGHEVSTIGVRTIGMFTAGLLAVCVVVCLILWLWMEQLKRRERRVDALYPGRLAVDVDQFPQPQLQQNPRTELARVKQEEDRRLHTYEWVDSQAGIARIPIARAMDILGEKGLPRVPAPAAVPGAPPRTSIPPARRREEPGQGTKPAPSGKLAEPKQEKQP